ncbi:unnamed protein product [Cuscuta campestris]|uniref:Uncharacterized protein n=1 Tax=Cuscuta campestris TaxID=132261 RepID=A0A484M4D2_9ASTE|nr:unnamed protein product [Cuscuta campestris]
MPSGPKKRRAARNKLNTSSSSSTPNPIVSTNINPDDNEVIPKVMEHGSKDVVEFVKEMKEDQHVLMVERDNVVVGAASGGGSVVEDDSTNNNNGAKGSQTAGAQKGDNEGGVSSVVAAAAVEAEEDNAASFDVKKATLGVFKDECPLKEYHGEMNQMIPKVAESSLEIPQDDAHNDSNNTTVVPDDEQVAVDGDCVDDDDYNGVKGNEIVPIECVFEVGAVEDKGTFRSKNEDSGFSVVKEMLCAGFKDERAFEEYFGKVLALVDDFDDGEDATSAMWRQQQFKALLLLHKDLIKKGALN